MLMTTTKEATRRTQTRRRSVESQVTPRALAEAPPITTVFVTGGQLHHSWCKQPLDYQGTRAGLELDFYCYRCVEHVSLPETVLSRIPTYANAAFASF
jgi:hypothetical protein